MALEENALTTVAAVSAQAPEGATEAEVEASINAVSQAIEDKLGRQLYRQTFTEESPDLYQGSGRPWLLLRAYPIVSVSYVAIDNHEVTDFQLIPHKAKSGQLFRYGGWPRTLRCVGDLTRDHDHNWADFTIKVAYVGGYITPGQVGTVNVPASLELAARLGALDHLHGEDGMGELTKEKTPGGWDREWAPTGSRGVYLSPKVIDLISAYRSRP